MTENSAYIKTVRAQQDAADPKISAFVSANAGSGKTRVLTSRVARLLLQNTAPSKILCITFTKAAAAEMGDRLFKLLGKWALADDDQLNEELNALEGATRQRDAEDLASARKLFARALETPGGLKIQTIHSFCESVLKRFPLEAGVAPGFQVLEESAATALANQSIDQVARAAAAGQGDNQSAFDVLTKWIAPTRLKTLIFEVSFSKRTHYEKLANAAGGWDALAAKIDTLLGISSTASSDDIVRSMLAYQSAETLKQWSQILISAGGNAQKRGDTLKNIIRAHDDNTRWQVLTDTFLTNDGAAYADRSITPKSLATKHPDLAAAITQMKHLIADAYNKLKVIDIARATKALLLLGHTATATYTKSKSRRAALDFDDLISHARLLLSAPATTQWVMYKLDQGIEHILLDEAQDTGPDAWSVIEALLAEFFPVASARQTEKTFFAVGDQKQSIYSFQGADALLFDAKQQDLGTEIARTSDFLNVPLNLSFRTTKPVLEFVDALFTDESVIKNVSNEKPLIHGVFRDGHAGCVELWPLAPRSDTENANLWDAPLDTISDQNPIAMLAAEVARKIKSWINGGEILESKGRPISAGDIMILLQSRSALYHEVIKALARERVTVAGPDKMQLLDDQGVLDLVSIAQTLLLPSDDLSLAETLKTPLFGLDDDALFDLAYNRGDQTLWAALQSSAKTSTGHQNIVETIKAARKVAQNHGPFSLFNWLLDTGTPSGREKFIQRLTFSCLEPINEFLQQAHHFETNHPRSLQGFLHNILQAGGTVSRDADQSSDAVRVMTVHKAKGLESPIVFMLDAGRTPNTNQVGPILKMHGDTEMNLPVLVPNTTLAIEKTTAAKEDEVALRHDEYRRLLYVAATRAEDRLYICGVGTKKTDKQLSWYQLAQAAFDRLDENVLVGPGLWDDHIKRLSCDQTAPVKQTAAEKQAKNYPLPSLFRTKAPTEKAPRRLSPSHLADNIEHGLSADQQARAYAPGLPTKALRRGTILHRLLEILPEISPERRDDAAMTLLANLASDVSPAERGLWAKEALETLNHPDFAEAFGPNSLAEVPIAGQPKTARRGIIISGQIDRLVITEQAVIAIDYKTNRPPPKTDAATPIAYLAQMAAYRALLQEIYPERAVKCAILWTYEARLMALSGSLLDDAFNHTLA